MALDITRDFRYMSVIGEQFKLPSVIFSISQMNLIVYVVVITIIIIMAAHTTNKTIQKKYINLINTESISLVPLEVK